MSIRLLTGAAIALAASLGAATAGEIPVSANGDTYNIAVSSWKELRFRTVMLQQYDFSCGSAALASLLTYHYKRPHTEAQVFEAMYRVGDQQSIRRSGFSLLDMKTYLQSIGLSSDGYRVSLDKIAQLEVPAITLIEFNGYKHFVIIKGIRDGRVLVGDPARGTRAIDRAEFEKMWSGIVLFIRNDIALAQASFNLDKDWSSQGAAPLAAAMRQEDIGSLFLHIRPSGLF
jgi:predicted double-glycine peptidase